MSGACLPEDEAPERDVFGGRMVEEAGPPGANHNVADALASAVGFLVQQTDAKIRELRSLPARPEGEVPASKPVLAESTSLAVGALEGKLKGHGLEGALKLAQIEEHYARAREANANAAAKEQEAERARQQAAWENLERLVTLIRTLGAEIKIAQLPDGTLGILIGSDLMAPLPLPQLEAGAES
jgi:hypothetical protein